MKILIKIILCIIVSVLILLFFDFKREEKNKFNNLKFKDKCLMGGLVGIIEILILIIIDV